MDAFEISVTLATGLVDLIIKPLKKESDSTAHYYSIVMNANDFTIIRKTADGTWHNVQGHVLNDYELHDVAAKIKAFHL